jgi:hypothetical protein
LSFDDQKKKGNSGEEQEIRGQKSWNNVGVMEYVLG